MADKKPEGETKRFTDLTEKVWFAKDGVISVGKTFSDIMEGKSEKIVVKEILYGNIRTWMIVTAKDEKVYLLKTAKNLG
jgi:hypothetical protein